MRIAPGRFIETASRRRLVGLLAALFGAANLVFYGMGVRFNRIPLIDFAQVLDPMLLRTRLIESLFYLHCQPPLLNLMLGGVEQLFPGFSAPVFYGLFLVLGFVLYGTLFALMRRLGVSRRLALPLSTLFLFSPSFGLYEHWLYYAFPVTTLLTLSALCLCFALETGRAVWLHGFFAALALLGGFWGLFHLLYFVLITLGLVVSMRYDAPGTGTYPALHRAQQAAPLQAKRPRGREIQWRVVRAAAVPFLMLFAVYAKNYLLFGQFTASTWTGMNMAWGVTEMVPLETRRRMVLEGQLSEVALLPPFSKLDAYPARYRAVRGYEAIPALWQERKSTCAPNYNHLAYIGIAAQYGRDNRAVMRLAPSAYARGIGRGVAVYFSSSSDYGFAGIENLNRLAPLRRLYDIGIYGQIVPGHPEWYVGLLIGLPLACGFGLCAAFRPGLLGLKLDRRQRAVVLFMAFNILYVMVVTNLLNPVETNRIRFTTDPFSLALFALFLQQCVRRSRAVWKERSQAVVKVGA